MKFQFWAHAERRVLYSAALAGAGVGLSLGALYMAGGLSQANSHHRAAQAVMASGEPARERQVVDLPGVLRTARDHDPLRIGLVRQDIAADLNPAAGARKAASDLECLTQAVYFEARGETPAGQAAVAQVVLNRVKHPSFPKTVCAVVYQGASGRGCQFSFACDGSTRRAREKGAWNRAHAVASRALAGDVSSSVGAATHFHTTAVSPNWGPRMLRVAQVGLHVFYRFGQPRPFSPAQPEGGPQVVFASLTPPAGEHVEYRLAAAMTAPHAQPAVVVQAATAPVAAPPPAPEAKTTAAVKPPGSKAAPLAKAVESAPTPAATATVKAVKAGDVAASELTYSAPASS